MQYGWLFVEVELILVNMKIIVLFDLSLIGM